jgi:phage regulator Rha-like protein
VSDLDPIANEIVFVDADGEPFTTTLVIAQETGNEHESIVRIVRDNLDDFEEFGVVRFEIGKPAASQNGGGRPVKYAVLTEPQSALLITYLRNNAKVRDFKKRLVRGFYAMRKLLAERAAAVQPLKGAELLAHAVLEANVMLEQKDARIAELDQKVSDDAPKVNYVELYVADTDLLKLRVVAANNNVGEEWLRDLLVAKGWVYVETESRFSERKGCKEIRRRYSAYSHKRSYFRPVEVHEAPRFRGEVMHTLKVTPTGAEAISRLIAKEAAA